MILTDKQIAEIAANLEFGMRCFYNLKTGEIKEVPDFTNWAGMDEESWDDQIEDQYAIRYIDPNIILQLEEQQKSN